MQSIITKNNLNFCERVFSSLELPRSVEVVSIKNEIIIMRDVKTESLDG